MRSLKRIAPAILLLACALLYPSAEARADAIEITSGYFSAGAPTPPARLRTFRYDFSGAGMSLSGSESDGRGQRLEQHCAPSPCAPGSSFNITHAAGLSTSMPSAFLQFNGQSFAGRALGTLNFVTGEMTWPPAGESVIFLTTHFTMTGDISFQVYDFVNGTTGTTFSVSEVYGSGIATVRIVQYLGLYFIDNVRYDFQPQTTPTPEPATLILLGSGLAGLAARHRRRRSRRRATQ